MVIRMNPILSAFLIVGGLGLFCSILLVIAVHFFKIEEEEKTKQIRACLPGVNCGACGYSGCDEYAKAVAVGECEPSLCVPGSTQVAKELSKLLNITIKVEEPKVAFVKCNGNCTSAAKKTIYDGPSSCKAANQIYGGPNACKHGCLGCGDCASVCPSNAICIKSGIAHIDPRACIGCGMCVEECPKNVIYLNSRESKVAVMCSSHDSGAVARKNCSNACIACKKCEKSCPSGAIVVTNNLAEIDYDKCTGCGICVSECPTSAIKSIDFSHPTIK